MEYICIGKIVQTHGIKGELRIRSNFLKKDRVFKKGFNLYLGEDKIKETINTYRPHKDFDMVTFDGYNNINEVLKYLKLLVYVRKEDIELKSDEYILEELVGLNVIEDGICLGKVREIVYNNSNILLNVVSDEHSFYIPNNANFIKKVNLDNNEVIVENAKGLIL
jgi:16S rRNA processing protein RimM